MTEIAIILASTRPNRVGEQVAAWVVENAAAYDDARFELVDLRDAALPHFDEPLSPFLGRYQNRHTQRWAETVAGFDGFVFVTPEYNHHIPGSLKDAIDFLHAEWHNKAAGIVSYGVAGGTGAAAQLRTMCGPLGIADVSKQVVLPFGDDFENYATFTPRPSSTERLAGLLEELIAWAEAIRPLREARASAESA